MSPSPPYKKNRDHHPPGGVIRVRDLMKRLERMAGARQRMEEGFYDAPQVLREIAEKLQHRLQNLS
jgi:hypothetical protein